MARSRWLSRRALVLHLLVVTIPPGCILAGWWQVHRALGGNLLSYFYSIEWPIFAILAVVAWWQLVHDEHASPSMAGPEKTKRSWLHRDEEVPSKRLVWDQALETPQLVAYNQYLKALSDGGGRKTWRNPRGLPAMDDDAPGPSPGASAVDAQTAALR